MQKKNEIFTIGTENFLQNFGYLNDCENTIRQLGRLDPDSCLTMAANQINHLKDLILQLIAGLEVLGTNHLHDLELDILQAHQVVGYFWNRKFLMRSNGTIKAYSGFGDFNDVQTLINATALDECELSFGMQIWFDAKGNQKGFPLNRRATTLVDRFSKKNTMIYGDSIITHTSEFMVIED